MYFDLKGGGTAGTRTIKAASAMKHTRNSWMIRVTTRTVVFMQSLNTFLMKNVMKNNQSYGARVKYEIWKATHAISFRPLVPCSSCSASSAAALQLTA
jgi:hypothetical protein